MRNSFLKVTAVYSYILQFQRREKIEIQSLPAFFLLSDEYNSVVLVSIGHDGHFVILLINEFNV